MFCQLPRDAASKVGESRLGVGKHVEDAAIGIDWENCHAGFR
jgi:hypothetical protein